MSRDIEKLTQAVNISIKKEQNRIKLIEIEKSFVKVPMELKNLFAEGTHFFIREGLLTKECRKTTKKRFQLIMYLLLLIKLLLAI